MVKFKVYDTDEPFYYDPLTHTFFTSDKRKLTSSTSFGPHEKSPFHIRVMFGSRCNFSCKYCHQNSTDPCAFYDLDIAAVVKRFPSDRPVVWSAWGGEALSRLPDLKELHAALARERPMARLTGLSTNGKLLKRHEAVDFLLETGAHVTLSYDGPGQHYRGEDVLKNAAVAVAVDRLLHAGQLVFSPTITNENFSLKEYIEWTQRYLSKQVLVGRLNMLQVSDAETMALAIPEDLLQAFSVKLAEEAFAVYGAQYSDGAVESFTRKLGRSGAFSCIAMSPGSMAITAGGASLACHNFPDPPAELMARHRVTPAKCGECPMLRFCHMGCPMRVLNEYDDYNCKAQYAWAFHLWVLGYNKTFGRNLERFLENDDAE